jgi:inner membrane protein
MGTALAALYAYLYVLLQLEDYALLLGTVGLFGILGTVMYVTRNLDWYALAPAAVPAKASS